MKSAVFLAGVTVGAAAATVAWAAVYWAWELIETRHKISERAGRGI